MMKLELNEVQLMMIIIEQSSFKGSDVIMVSSLIEKLQKEQIKLQPQG